MSTWGPSRRQRGRVPQEPPGPRGHILLVEDDPDAAYYAVHVLTRLGGFDVSHTPDPAVALQRAAALPWDLLITDVDLPGMTGLELLTTMRQAVPGLPVAVMTSRADDGPIIGILRSEVNVFLEKPVLPAQLIAVVSALVTETKPRHSALRSAAVRFSAHQASSC